MNKTKIDLIELLEEWHKVKKSKEMAYGNWREDDVIVTLWLNPSTLDWEVDEKRAFKGFVARKISGDIDKLWES